MRYRTAAITLSVIAGLMLVTGLAVWRAQTSDARRVDVRLASQQLNTAVSSLNDDEENLAALVADWADWDEAREYFAGDEPGFLTRYATDGSLEKLGVGVVAAVSTDGNIIGGPLAVRGGAMSGVTLSAMSTKIQQFVAVAPRPSGITSIENSTFFIARAEVTDAVSGSVIGDIVFLRPVDAHYLGEIAARLESETRVSISAIGATPVSKRVSSAGLPAGWGRDKAGYSQMVQGFDGEPAALIVVERPTWTSQAWLPNLLLALSGLTSASAMAAFFAPAIDAQQGGRRADPRAMDAREPDASDSGMGGGVDRLNEEIEAAHAAQRRLLRGVGHDLRSPLASIVLMSDALADGEMGTLSQDQMRACRLTADTARRLMGQVEVLYARAEALSGLDDAYARATSVAEVARVVAAALLPVAEAKSVELVVETGGTGDNVLCDPRVIERIVANLVDNAVKFTDTGRIDVSVDSSSSEVVLRVVDTGCGIAAEDLPRVTDEYYRAAANGGTEGAGVGLSVTLELVRNLGGTLDIASEPDRGTSVTVVLPARPTPSS